MPVTQEDYNEALKNFKSNIRLVNNAVEKKDFLVGSQVTIADVMLALPISMGYQTFLDPGFRKSVPHLDKWLLRCIALPEFKRRIGNVKPCQKTIKPTLAPKEEKKAAAP